MKLSLGAEAEKLIAERVQSGRYSSAEDVVTAALHALARHECAGEFAPGELDALIEEGEASGAALDGPTVLAELRKLHAGRQVSNRNPARKS